MSWVSFRYFIGPNDERLRARLVERDQPREVPSALNVINLADLIGTVRHLLAQTSNEPPTGTGQEGEPLDGPTDVGGLRRLTATLRVVNEAMRVKVKNAPEAPGDEVVRIGVGAVDPLLEQQLHDLPLEAAKWADGPDGGSASRLLVRQSDVTPDRPALPPDEDVRALVVVHERTAFVCTEAFEALKELTDNTNTPPTVLFDPSWERVQSELQNADRRYNLFAYVGHTHVGSKLDRARYLTFGAPRQYNPDLPAESQSACCPNPTDVANEVLNSLPHLRCVVLLGCQTWPDVTRHFLRVPALVGMQFRVLAGETQSPPALVAFLKVLRESGRVDRAYLALRQAFADAAGGPHHAVWPVLHLNGESVDFVARDQTLLAKIAYARKLVSDEKELKYLPSLDGTADPSAPRATCYFDRVVQYQVEKKTEESRAAAGQKVELIPHDEKEEWVRERLVSAAGGLHLGVKAQGGTGKSALLREVAFDLASQFLRNPTAPNARLPVLVELGRLEARERKMTAEELAEARVRSRVFHELPDAPVTFTDYVFLFDGLDEMTWRTTDELKSKWGHLAFKTGALQSTRAVVASRPEAVAPFKLPHFDETTNRPNILDLRPLVYPAEVAEFADRLCRQDGQGGRVMAAIDRSPSLQAAVTLPFYLRLLCDLAGDPTVELPDTATRVLDEAIELLIERRNANQPSSAGRIKQEHQHLLAAVAFAEMAWSGTFTLEDALDVLDTVLELYFTVKKRSLRDRLKHAGPTTNEDLWELLRSRTGLLNSSSDSVKFHDPRVRTFLAAKHLADLLTWYELNATAPIQLGDARTVEEVVLAAAGRREWRRVLVHLAGLLDREDRLTWLLKMLAEHEEDPPGSGKPAAFNMTLGLACRCCGELSHREQLDNQVGVRQQVNGVAWRAWQVVEPLNALQMRISPVARQIGHLVNAEATLAVTDEESTGFQATGPAGTATKDRLLLELILDRVARGE